jgi:L-arabinose isomerase
VQQDTQPITLAAAALNDVEIRREMEEDRTRYVVEATEESHFRSAQAGLALSRMVNELGCGACSFNFLAFDRGEGALSTVPFLGASKLMAEGFGYAGEGDALTAALVGALNGIFRVNFTEMFCPDWRNNSIFLSHMGEFNPACAEGPVRLVEKPFPWTAAQNPAIVTGAMQRGPAVLVNLAPGPDDRFRLIAAPVDVLDDAVHPEMRDSIRGWFRPPGNIARFLEWYSRAGGTHHCALVHDLTIETMRAFASYAGIPIEFPHKRGEWGA